MSQPTNLPSFWSRLSLAFGAFFKTLGDAEFAARVRDDQIGPIAAPRPAPAPAPRRPPRRRPPRPRCAWQRPTPPCSCCPCCSAKRA
jgi:hypothetical protein